MIRKKEPSEDNFSEPFESHGMSGTSAASPYNRYLKIEDIKYVTGLRDVKQVEFHPAEFLGGDLNFVNELGGKILCVAFFRASLYNTYWAAVPKSLKTRVYDIGEDAFFVLDLNGREPFMLVFRMGNHAVSLTTATTKEAKRNLLTVDELITIGNIVASRLEER